MFSESQILTETNAVRQRVPDSGSEYQKSASQTGGWYVELEEVWTWKSVKLR